MRPRRSIPAFVAVVLLTATGCRGRSRPAPRDAGTPRAAAGLDAGPGEWPELAELPRAEPIMTIDLPVAPGVPLASMVGPVAVSTLAVLGSSQFGFVAIDWRDGHVAWRRAAGPHLAPPLAHDDGVLVVGDCERTPLARTGQVIVGCWRVVSPTGSDVGAGVLAGDASAVAAFVAARGPERMVPLDDHRSRWTRGDAAVDVDLDTGLATPAPVVLDGAIALYRGREWHIAIEPDEALVARDAAGAEQWRMTTRFAAVIGVLPGQSYEVPMVRVVNLAGAAGRGVVDLIDIDATGSKRGQAGATVPGLQLLGHAFAGAPGDTALAVRLDTTLRRDFISAHDARGGLAWVWPLPERTRVEPVGLAFADDGSVLVFHDGDRLVVLPAVSRRATSPGSPAGASQNPTP